MKIRYPHPQILIALATIVMLQLGSVGHAQQPTAENALKLAPIQKNVDYDRPTPE